MLGSTTEGELTMRSRILQVTCGCVLALTCAASAFADTFKAGLLTEGSATESGWNKIAYSALQRIGEELDAEISNVEMEANPASFRKAFEDYAALGYDVVIGHGFQFKDAALEAAAEFPDTVFLITSSDVFEGNVVGVNLNTFQPFFLMGVIAASRGDKAGYIGGVEIPPITNALTGFRNGTKYVNPDFKVLEVMTGSWNDLAAAKEAALSMISNGADTIVPNANISALGAFQAVTEHPGIVAFGTFGDYTDKAPQQILGNYTPDLSQGFLNIAREIKEGRFAPDANILFGLEHEDVVILQFNDGAEEPVSEEMRAELAKIKAKLISGEIDPTVP